MPTLRRTAGIAATIALCCAALTNAVAQTHITTPKEEFGANFGDDYFLASYKQIAAYWHKLDRQSDRMVVEEIGKTAEGRSQLMAIVTSPENQKKLAHYKDISARLAHAEGLTDAQARALAKEGKAVVEAGGSTMANVLKCTVFLTDVKDFGGMNSVYSTFFPKEPPARSTVVVAALVSAAAKVEIECIAAVTK